MAISVIYERLLNFSQRVAKKLVIKTIKCKLNGKNYELPLNNENGEPIILIRVISYKPFP